jgi:hypothetical protein
MDSEALSTLADMTSRGPLHTPVPKVFDLGDAGAAYKAFAIRSGRGRILLAFSGPVTKAAQTSQY